MTFTENRPLAQMQTKKKGPHLSNNLYFRDMFTSWNITHTSNKILNTFLKTQECIKKIKSSDNF